MKGVEVVRKVIILLVLVLSLLPLKAEALVRTSQVPHQKTLLEELPELLTNIYKGAMACTTISQNGYSFVVSPVEIIKVPSNYPIQLFGKFHPSKVRVELWMVNGYEAEFVRNVSFCYYQFSETKIQRYNFHLRNDQKYQVRVFILDNNGCRRLVVSWCFQTLANDPPNKPQLPQQLDDDDL